MTCTHCIGHRSLLIAAVLLALPPPAVALGQGVEFGIKAGLSRSDFRGRASDEWNARSGPAGGVFVDLRLSHWLSIRSELFLTPKEVFKSDTVGSVEIRFDRTPLYLDVPVLARITFPNLRSPVKPGLLLGFALSFELACTETSFSRDLTDGVTLNERAGDCALRLTVPESPEIGAVIGLVTELRVVGVPVGLEARYTRGLFDLGHSRFAAEQNFPEYRNAVASVLMYVTLKRSN